MFCVSGRSAQATKRGASMEGNCRDILVVEDDGFMRTFLTHILTRLGHAVFLAENGKEGLDALRVRAFDLIITDLSMPEMDGISLAYIAKKMSIPTPMVLITGNDRADVLPKAARAPIDHIIFKPFGLAEVRNIIDKFLPGKPTITA